jgi:hypothetical protein
MIHRVQERRGDQCGGRRHQFGFEPWAELRRRHQEAEGKRLQRQRRGQERAKAAAGEARSGLLQNEVQHSNGEF